MNKNTGLITKEFNRLINVIDEFSTIKTNKTNK